ncbi:MAG: hypothetical protein JWP52_2675, partial [Rhizobacter sp.]|nr:hypothetical protein [Rhizobacter sp.]
FFKQREFVIRSGAVRWIDELRGAPPLSLSNVTLVIRNGLLKHDVRLDATPPTEWGERFSLVGKFQHRLLAHAGDVQRWSGQAYASFPRADLHGLRRYLTLPFDLTEGDGAVRAWIDVAGGMPRRVITDVALRTVTLQFAHGEAPLSIEQVEGRLVGQRTPAGYTFEARRFGFATSDGLQWPRADLDMTWRQPEGAPVSNGGEVRAERLDLNTMAQIAARLPVGRAMRRLLDDVAPQGSVNGLIASWEGPLDAPLKYDVKAQLSDLTLSPGPVATVTDIGRPGLRAAQIALSASERGGEAAVVMNAGAIELPGVYAEPVVPLDTLSGKLRWTITPSATAGAPPDIAVRAADIRFANTDTAGEINAEWHTGAGAGYASAGRFPGVLELDGRLSRGKAERLARYLPLELPADVRSYVKASMLGGRLRDTVFRVSGDMNDFPFTAGRHGEFRIASKMEDVTFAYVPDEAVLANGQRRKPGSADASATGWPVLNKMSGEVVFDRTAMTLSNVQALIGGLPFTQVHGGIADMENQPVLMLEGMSRAPAGDMLHFVKATPIGEWTSHALRDAAVTGSVDLTLALRVPLDNVEHTGVKGSFTLAGNEVRIRPDLPVFTNAAGHIEFTENGFGIVGGRAGLLGGDATFSGGMQPDGSMRFTGQGTATAEALRRSPELGVLAQTAGLLNGQAAWKGALGFVHGQTEFSVSSNLVGMGSDFPAPLNKAALTALPMTYSTALVAESPSPSGAAAKTPRDVLKLDIGDLLHVQFVRELGASTRVISGGIGVQEPAPTPASGVAANISVDKLNTDLWEGVAKRLNTPAGASSGSAAAIAQAAAAASVVVSDDAGYMPTTVALRAQEFMAGTRRLSRVVAGFSEDDGLWRGNVDADQLNGYVEYRPARRTVGGNPANAAGRVYARLARLQLPETEADSVESLLDEQPASVPALDIVVNDFELRGKRLGRIEIEAANRVSGEGRDMVREWRLARFIMSTPEAQMTASGNWAAAPGSTRRHTSLDFRLDLADSGAFLGRLGTPGAIRGGKGRLQGTVGWAGSPTSLDYATMTGQVNVAIESGQFLKVNPGAARLLSVLSLQALPRRLAFDFRDLFQQGFAFDGITGDVTIAQGVAQTDNLRMRGVQAVVVMAGSADLERETQDLRVVVVPEINAGTASLAMAAINPALGLGTYLAQLFLRKPIAQAGTREFHITGSWDEPKVDRVPRKPTEPLPELATQEPAASAPAAASAVKPTTPP